MVTDINYSNYNYKKFSSCLNSTFCDQLLIFILAKFLRLVEERPIAVKTFSTKLFGSKWRTAIAGATLCCVMY